jgi:hypothetical protein
MVWVAQRFIAAIGGAEKYPLGYTQAREIHLGETMKRKTTYKPFDAAAYLDNDAVIAEYLSAAAEDSNPDGKQTKLPMRVLAGR